MAGQTDTRDVLIVGAGIAGLTAGAYLARAGLKVLLCEKEKKTGGLVNSFEHNGFTFDGGMWGILRVTGGDQGPTEEPAPDTGSDGSNSGKGKKRKNR